MKKNVLIIITVIAFLSFLIGLAMTVYYFYLSNKDVDLFIRIDTFKTCCKWWAFAIISFFIGKELSKKL